MPNQVRQWPMFAGNPSRGVWLNVDTHARTVQAYGVDDPVEVTATEDPEGTYYGWIDADSDGAPVMVQPHEGLFSMQFPYGPKAEVDRGRGEIVRLRVEPSA